MKRVWAAVVGGAMLAATQSGCATSTQITKITDSATSPAKPGQSSTPEGGTATMTVGALAVVAGAPVRCDAYEQRTFISVAKDPDARGLTLTGDPPALETVNLGEVNGLKFMYYELLKKDGESATLTKDGKHYTVKGTVRGSDSQGTDGMIKPFRVDVTCP
ncbi:lipoprotein LpqH [Mycobacteroides abscessus]|uniref:Mycobacterium 19 kDa lipoprotein antigen n=2 Tax=Mycobacteroides abscessus TaxID=36809 RepID=A0A0U0ZPF3_9MYCO|nr:lipoprotein LpqH [Mycobacteroides abscessus]AMU29901.1 hypothetical protein A3N97_04290 [Mycobacteroides abscessus]AMU74162.1 hypothetical protein A3O06_05435 [Mycobacteroides abscessus]ANN97998.1 hypothetical protein BAB74_03995 [Mycobacteroides abscessus]ANO23099.1 hypothetical protein BAB79_05430 [Mycobacteroides abscessus]EIV67299.1 hypothetical protein MMCCUG48898_0627 [Mycobacteroides abscessus subsp. massiliense CCUG 48898 = JCM 15300]